jgi:hypothetical protein
MGSDILPGILANVRLGCIFLFFFLLLYMLIGLFVVLSLKGAYTSGYVVLGATALSTIVLLMK